MGSPMAFTGDGRWPGAPSGVETLTLSAGTGSTSPGSCQRTRQLIAEVEANQEAKE